MNLLQLKNLAITGSAAIATLWMAPVATAQTPPASATASASSTSSAPTSGIERSTMDPAVRAQDDFFRHVNGTWLRDTPFPADRPSIGSFQQIHELIQDQLRLLVEGAGDGATDPGARQLGELYASFMDEPRLEPLGTRPLAAELTAIDAVTTPQQLGPLMARLTRLGVAMPLDLTIEQDARDATRYLPHLSQGRQGLPDRDYYLNEGDARFKEAREQYVVYLSKLLTLAGDTGRDASGNALNASGSASGSVSGNASGSATLSASANPPLGAAANTQETARAVLGLETELSRAQWTRVENRDPVKTYNRFDRAGLQKLAPAADWNGLLDAAGFNPPAIDLVVAQPSYLTALAALQRSTPLATWKAYARTHLLSAYAPYLGKAFVDARFAFVGTVLSGTPQNRPRWQRGVMLVQESLGEGLGQLYVEKYFPPASKAQMEQLVANLLQTYKRSIATLDWMSPATKKEAQIKLATFMPKIGYPKRWIDYSALKIAPDDLAGNVMRARSFDYDRHLAKLGKPVDRDEWGMTPQTVNAYYNPSLNEIVFPAAVLQPPFFDPRADAAVNYGAIGAVIGHEISHGFDDQGSQFDAKGNLRDWWTAADRDRFKLKTQALVAQYAAFVPVPGYPLNGELTLGENIADNSGLEIAYKAYHLSLNGKPAPVIDGMTGDERFFLGFAQVWRGKQREAAMLAQIKSDPHSPNEFRVNGTVRNHPAYYTTFGLKPGDKLYLPPTQRVSIW